MGPCWPTVGDRPSFRVVAFLFCCCLEILSSACSSPIPLYHASDECDWTGSGLERGVNRTLGVQPVYLRCREGRVQWQYPRGALRIVLRLGTSGKDFYGCVLAGPEFTGAQLYLEGPNALRPLIVPSSSREGERCFVSKDGQAALFLEAPVDEGLTKRVLDFRYDLQPLRKREQQDCRPCSESELLFLFCAADFVVRGTMSSLYHNTALQQTELTVRSNLVFRDTEPKVFSRATEDPPDIQYGVLHRPLHCGTKAGSGEFLFLGRWRLGLATVSCAPRWTEWKKVRRKALIEQTADCLLN